MEIGIRIANGDWDLDLGLELGIRIVNFGFVIGIRDFGLRFGIGIENSEWGPYWAIFQTVASPTFHMQFFWWLRYSEKKSDILIHSIST